MNNITNNQSVEPYLFFGGRCEEALAFYRKTLGADVQMLTRFKDAPGTCGVPEDWAEKIMHANLRIGETTVLVSDGCWTERSKAFEGFALSLSVPNEAEADRRFNALAAGGQIKMPMDKTFFAQRFGLVTDRFGVCWMVIVPAEEHVAAGKREAVAC
jgi:PhnB protein